MSGCANCYDLGSAVLLTATFTGQDGVTPADPTTVTLRVKDPNGVETTPTATKMSTGVYEYTFTPLVAGVWFYRFEGAGVVTAVMESNFVVAASMFADAAA